jgi:hypothetical protein
MWSKACTATAGGARIRRSRSNRRSRRNRKTNRKNRSNRRNRKSGSRKHRGGGLVEDVEAALMNNRMDPEMMLSKMINTPGYKSGMTQVMGKYTFKAEGSSRYFYLYVKNSTDDDSTYVIIKTISD